MKVLIAILSCHKEPEAEEAQRSTFLRDCKVDYRFFLGNTGDQFKTQKLDQVQLDCGDKYKDLPFKTKGICSWALKHGYEYIFKCDTDTLIHTDRLMNSGFDKYHYTGFYRGAGPSYASGGPGYWLNFTAMSIIESSVMTPDYRDGARGFINGEDLQVGRNLIRNFIECHWDGRYRLDNALPHPNNDHITCHPVLSKFKGRSMVEAYNRMMENFK